MASRIQPSSWQAIQSLHDGVCVCVCDVGKKTFEQSSVHLDRIEPAVFRVFEPCTVEEKSKIVATIIELKIMF